MNAFSLTKYFSKFGREDWEALDVAALLSCDVSSLSFLLDVSLVWGLRDDTLSLLVWVLRDDVSPVCAFGAAVSLVCILCAAAAVSEGGGENFFGEVCSGDERGGVGDL